MILDFKVYVLFADCEEVHQRLHQAFRRVLQHLLLRLAKHNQPRKQSYKIEKSLQKLKKWHVKLEGLEKSTTSISLSRV